MKKEKFNISFKNNPKPTGLSRICAIDGCKIFVNKNECGFISGPSIIRNGTDIYMRFMKNDIMEDGNPNCTWINLKLNHPNNFKSLKEAKEYIKLNLQEILSKINYKLKMDES